MDDFTPTSFDQALDDVRKARAWYSELDICTTGTRLEAIEQELQALVSSLEKQPPAVTVQRFFNRDTYFAYLDGIGFGKIQRAFEAIGPNLLPRDKLKIILEGPLRLTDETPGRDGSDNARNTFFELELAAALIERGLDLTGFNDLQ